MAARQTGLMDHIRDRKFDVFNMNTEAEISQAVRDDQSGKMGETDF